MIILLSQIIIDSIKESSLKGDFIIKFLEPESLYIKLSNKYYYFYMGYIPYEMKLPEGSYYIEYHNKKDSLFLKGGYIYNIKFPNIEVKSKPKIISYEYSIKKEFNKDLNRDSCYIVIEGEIDSLTILFDENKLSYKVPSEFMFPAKKTIKIISKNIEKEIFLEPQFIYYINIKSK